MSTKQSEQTAAQPSETPASTPITITSTRHRARLWAWWCMLVHFVTLECLLTRHRIANGGAVILARTLWTSLFVYGALLLLHNAVDLVDRSRSWTFEWEECKTQLRLTFGWFAAIFGATYAGLYARFASQWSYLASVYHQIKASECGGGRNAQALAEWKAGFIEDAEELHLATKPSIAATIEAWNAEDAVRLAFEKHSPGGGRRLKQMLHRAADAITTHERERGW